MKAVIDVIIALLMFESEGLELNVLDFLGR